MKQQLLGTLFCRIISRMSKSSRNKTAPLCERKSSSALVSSTRGLRFDATDDMSPFEKVYRKFLKKLNKTVVELKHRVSLSTLPKELAFIQEGLSGILDLSLKFRLHSESLFHTLETTVTTDQNTTKGKQQTIPLLSTVKREPGITTSTAPISTSDADSKQSKRLWWECDAFSVEGIPDINDLSTKSNPSKRPCIDVDVPDSTKFNGPLDDNFNIEGDWVTVFIDGACSDNGRTKAKAGLGVWFYPDCPFNVAEPVRSSRHTNNVAEIEASIRAIQQAHLAGIRKLRVKTDSMFLINCITKWRFSWVKNGWKTASGKPVINKPEVEELSKVMKMLPLEIDWVHVKAHSGIIGNEAADFLARQGAERSS